MDGEKRVVGVGVGVEKIALTRTEKNDGWDAIGGVAPARSGSIQGVLAGERGRVGGLLLAPAIT